MTCLTDNRVLITGAGGFLGSHIARYFGEKGDQVAAVGRFAATPVCAGSYPNLWKLCGMTLPDQSFLNVISDFQPTLLVHCAGTASVADSVQDPYSDFRRTVEVCAFALEAARIRAPNCRFILLSSASVYGNPGSLPITEMAPTRPVSPYGYHKMLCETLVEEYASLHGLRTAVLRIFSAYGERLLKQVVHDICQKFSDPDSPTVELFGTGKESRDFIHAFDIARAIECIVETDASGIYNLASGVQTTIMELSGIIGEIFDNGKPVRFNCETRPGDPFAWQAAINKIEALGFHQTVAINEGLSRYVSWFRSLCENGDFKRS